MLTYKQKSNWVIRNQDRMFKVEKEIKALEDLISKINAHKECLEYNFHRELQLFGGTPTEYNKFFEKHEADIAKCNNTIEEKSFKLRRLKSLVNKLISHEKVIFAMPHIW